MRHPTLQTCYIISAWEDPFYANFWIHPALVSGRKVADFQLDFRTDNESLCPYGKNTLRLFSHGAKQSTRCGDPAWWKTCKYELQ